jgi:hypothetical protein
MTNKFIKELKTLCEKHGVFLLGNHRIANAKDYEAGTLQYTVVDEVTFNGIKDRSANFLVGSAQRKIEQNSSAVTSGKFAITIIDYEKPMGTEGGVQSPVDEKVYTSRMKYEQHLKDTGHRISGDSSETTRKKIEQANKEAAEAKAAAPFEWNSCA